MKFANIFDDDYFESAMEDSVADKINRSVGEPLRKTFKEASDRFVDAVTNEAENRDRLYKNRNSSPLILYKGDLTNMPYPHRDVSWNYLINYMVKNRLTITYKKSFIVKNTAKDIRRYDFVGIMNDKTNKEARHPNYERAKKFMMFLKSNRSRLSKAEDYKEFIGIINSFKA